MTKELGKSSTGLQPNVAGLLCYLAGFITGIIFFVIEKDNKFVKFHAMQSIVTFGTLFALQIVFTVLVFSLVLVPVVNIIGLILWVILMIKAYQGEMFKLPIVGEFAEKKS